MHDWDLHLDVVMGAYNSTRHATTGFWLLCNQQALGRHYYLRMSSLLDPSNSRRTLCGTHPCLRTGNPQLGRRNQHQAQQRQKVGPLNSLQRIWVFCRRAPQKGSPKLMKTWRGPHKKAQEGRVYVFDTGKKFTLVVGSNTAVDRRN